MNACVTDFLKCTDKWRQWQNIASKVSFIWLSSLCFLQKSPYSDYKIVNIQQNFQKLSTNVYVFKRCWHRGFVWSKSLSLHFLLKSKSWMYINNKENWCNSMLHMCKAQNHRPYSNTQNTTIRRATLVRVERINSILTGNIPPAGRGGFLLGGAGWGEGDRTENTNASSKSKVLANLKSRDESVSWIQNESWLHRRGSKSWITYKKMEMTNKATLHLQKVWTTGKSYNNEA